MAKNDDDVRFQIASIMKELNEGVTESAASVLLRQHRNAASVSPSLFKLIFKLWGKKIIIFILVVMIAVAASAYYLSGSTKTTDTTTFVEQVHDLATLATAEAHIKVVIEEKDNKIFGKEISMDLPGTKRELLLVVPATVVAGVDLKGINADQIHINEKEKELEISLPHATFLQDPAIEMDKVTMFSDEGLFRSEVDWSEGFDLASAAQKKIKAEAIDIGLLQRAEQSADKVLTEFFGNLGYTVKLTFH